MESRIREAIKADLLNTDVVEHVKKAVRAALAENEATPREMASRIGTLQKEIANLTDAIAAGVLRSSPAVAARLVAAEEELAKILEQKHRAPVVRLVPNIEGCYRSLVERLDQTLARDVERSQAALMDVLGIGSP